ncbi:acyl-CoA dehydrogenase family protein [Actinomadura madurae]|uniref:acyl-CoA dehydrogenase family protein n=2 Tax=Actinomadura madurae TaxID=1993 RepID=UPI0020D1FD9A|nr:acyl-CoA dehydrogenase family protein [Actinomadura madurae]MCP9948771.1 acyl-CoA/acyl-ACP dehydrogenase [Actinomadura madurae]MCP9965546.1 acyl-CoA/acyl-ACP dehydrogenase [Actinomadura madurae]MCQ0010470.1 acyl-CoA/acyl-ACP dehydrogenase [Actinomadura madurae]
MRLVVTEEQRELRDALRRFFADRSPAAEVRRLMGTAEGYDPKVWAQMAEQLGLQGLAIAEEHGGAGFGVRELAVVFEEMGRAVVCAPFLATITAAAALEAGDGGHDLLPGIADGSVIATLAVAEDGGSWDPGDVETTFEDGKLWGAKSFVLDGHIADLVLVAARGHGGVGIYAVEDVAALSREVLPTLDQTRKLARVGMDGVPAREVGGRDALLRALDVAAVVLAAEELGGAQKALDMTVEYVKVRRQFGRPIGSFQAIKHRCADMFVLVESARSAVLNAAAAADEGPGELPAAAALAKAYCSDAYFHTAGEAIQLHGGIGFTWEHDAHLYFKRAQGSRQLFGAPDRHRERLAALAGITGAAAAP